MRRASWRSVPSTYRPPSSTHALAELDVDAAAGHVRRDRDRADLARVLDDLGLALVLLRVQDVVRDPLRASAAADRCSERLDGDRADEHRLPVLVALLDVLERPRRTSPPSSCRCSRSGRRARPPRWSGSRRRAGRRSRRTPSPRSSRYRSCRRASRRGGSSSGA